MPTEIPARTILSCGPCRAQGRRFTAPATPAGDRKMDAHLTAHHPRSIR